MRYEAFFAMEVKNDLILLALCGIRGYDGKEYHEENYDEMYNQALL